MLWNTQESIITVATAAAAAVDGTKSSSYTHCPAFFPIDSKKKTKEVRKKIDKHANDDDNDNHNNNNNNNRGNQKADKTIESSRRSVQSKMLKQY